MLMVSVLYHAAGGAGKCVGFNFECKGALFGQFDSVPVRFRPHRGCGLTLGRIARRRCSRVAQKSQVGPVVRQQAHFDGSLAGEVFVVKGKA